MNTKIIVVVNNDLSELEEAEKVIQEVCPETKVCCYADPMLAMKYLYDEDVTCVFAETKMRPVTGYQFMKVLHQEKTNIPIVLLSNFKEEEVDVKRVGADEFILKPLTKEKVLLVMKKFI